MINAKTQRPGVCNAAETLLVHEAVADAFLPRIAASLTAAGVSVRADARARELVRGAPSVADGASGSNGASRRCSRPARRTGPPSTWR